jgi:hypothetical protein
MMRYLSLEEIIASCNAEVIFVAVEYWVSETVEGWSRLLRNHK